MSDTWYNRNEKTIKWATLIGSWAVGIACIATGLSAPVGIAIITAGSGYAGGKTTYRWIKNKRTEKREEIENGS